MKRILLAGAAGLAASAAFPLAAQAQSVEHPNSISVGAYAFRFNSESEDLSGPLTPPGLGAEAEDTEAVAIVYARQINPRWSVNLAFGIPPKVELTGARNAAPLGKLGEADAIAPALTVHYSFNPEGRFRPFVGGGVAYTRFEDPTPSASLEAALGGPTTIEIEDSISPAVTAGFDYDFTDRMFGTLSATYIEQNGEATLRTGTIRRETEIELNPVVYRATVGFRF